MKAKFFIVGLVIFFLLLISTSSLLISHNNQPEFEEDHLHLVVRSIGDKILRQVGDSTTALLPVNRLDATTFQINFQNSFSFVPDSLVKLIHNQLKINNLSNNYRVKILDCQLQNILYGYEINKTKNELIPCLGRLQDKACYRIQISFLKNNHLSPAQNPYVWVISLSNLVLLFLLFKKPKKPRIPSSVINSEDSISLGKYAFCVQQQVLKNKTEIIELSDKETKLLKLFTEHSNQILTRDTLIKEIWENEGVFVGSRTLDVFVSKLRKKIQNDKSLKISNIHGKGYKLEII